MIVISELILGVTCLCSVDNGFPVVSFHFEDSLSLTVYPHEYLFKISVSKLEHILDVNSFIWFAHIPLSTSTSRLCRMRSGVSVGRAVECRQRMERK